MSEPRMKKLPGGKRILQGNIIAGPGLTDEEALRLVDMKKKFKDPPPVGKYKVEVLLGKGMRMDGTPFPGVMTLWESGNQLHGGGDSLLYICPGKDCNGVIPEALNDCTLVACPKCNGVWKCTELTGQIFFRLPVKKWAEVIVTWMARLELNCDVRIKYNYDDIRQAASKEQERDLGSEVLDKVRSKERRVVKVYPLEHIIKDTSAGADLYGRILAFLRD